MKALKSELANAILRNPENRDALRRAMLSAGYGPSRGCPVTVVPMTAEGRSGDPLRLNMYFMPKA